MIFVRGPGNSGRVTDATVRYFVVAAVSDARRATKTNSEFDLRVWDLSCEVKDASSGSFVDIGEYHCNPDQDGF